MMTAVLILAAIAVVLWPASKPPGRPLAPVELSPPAPPRPPHPSYHASIGALAQVRQRLAQTEQLGEDQDAAVALLTLALVAGSDRE
jgi:hypothetical protein